MGAFLQTGKRYAVVGLGASGLSAVRFLHSRGYAVSVTDGGFPDVDLPNDVACFFGGIDEKLLLSVDGIIISPGVNPNQAPIIRAKAQGIAVVSDVQLCIDECHKNNIPIVAITGSNAKSTVTTLVGQMAQRAGLLVGVGGNLGTPALDLLQNDIQLCVLELSSFQLEHISALSAQVATILNLSADHLDRHGTMQNYLRAKLNILDNTQNAVLFADDADLQNACVHHLQNHSPNAQMHYVSSHTPKDGQFGIVKDGDVLFLAYGTEKWLRFDQLHIFGIHNLTNALFALAIGKALGLSKDTMLAVLQEFKGLAHRCQFVARVGQKDYFNDSKGTNIGATTAAIVGLGQVYGAQSLIVIVGGVGKGQSFGELAPVIQQFAAHVLAIGQDGQQILNELSQAGSTTPSQFCSALQVALQVAQNLRGRAVLLSPACASFDQFAHYEARGECFVQLVQALPAPI